MSQVRRAYSSLLLAVLFYSSFAWAAGELVPEKPDLKVTPGVLCSRQDQDFEEYRYKEKVPYCFRNVDSELKDRVYEAYKVPENKRRNYTVDHFLPLSIGGNNDFANLWPEHKKIKALRMNLEMQVYSDLRANRITQEEAIERIVREKMNPPLPLGVSAEDVIPFHSPVEPQ